MPGRSDCRRSFSVSNIPGEKGFGSPCPLPPCRHRGRLLAHINKIRRLNCFIPLVVLTVAVVEFALILVPLVGRIILFLLTPAFIIFTYRSITLIYESAPATA